MKIEFNSDIEKFITDSAKNIIDFAGDTYFKYTPEKEKFLLNKYRSQGLNLDTLKIDSSLILDNPYFKNISLKPIDKYNNFEYSLVKQPKNMFMNVAWMLPGVNKSLDDFVKLGYYTKDMYLPVLKQGSNVWMSPSLAEQTTIDPYAKKAFGHVLTFGLGIGYFVYMASINDKVTEITVVEKDSGVIEMFKEFILPQFNTSLKINIIQSDIFDVFNNEFLDKFDSIFVDVWMSNEDGLNILEKLLTQCNYKGNIDYWVEFSCYYSVRTLMMVYFKALIDKNLSDVICNMDGENKGIFKKIHRYFRNTDLTVISSNVLKNYMYDNSVIREILSIDI